MKKRIVNGMSVLFPEQGKMLKNGTTYADTAVIGKYDKEDEWQEVDMSEYEEYQKSLIKQDGDILDVKAEGQPATPDLPTTLEMAKERKIAEIKDYDSSDAVNSFTLNGMPAWINREDRIGTRRAIELDIENGQTESEIWLNGVRLVVNSKLALKLLDMVGHYAYKAYNVTQSHLYAVRQLQIVSEVEAYNYRTGYPEKLDLKTI